MIHQKPFMPEHERFTVIPKKIPKDIRKYNKEIISILKEGIEIRCWEYDKAINKIKKISFNKQGRYRISDISPQSKYSKKYKNCMGLFAKGISDNNISEFFITHHDTRLCFRKKHQFLHKLSENIIKLLDKSKYIPDVVLIWWNWYFYIDNQNIYKEWYINGVKEISETIKKTLWYYPRVFPPKQTSWFRNIYANTTDIYVHETNERQEHSYKPFTWENIEEMKKLWEATQYKGV